MPIKYFKTLNDAQAELIRQQTKRHYPRLGSRIIYGDLFSICIHDESCICGKCPMLCTKDELI
jgi:hypothetical protein